MADQVAVEVSDLGTWWVGEAREFTLPLSNEGPRTISILKIETGCRCRTATASADEVAPGASVTIHGRLSPRTRIGDLAETLEVRFADQSLVKLPITGRITSRFDFDPAGLTAEPGAGDAASTAMRMTLHNRSKAAVSFVEPRMSPAIPGVGVTLEPRQVAADGHAILTVTLASRFIMRSEHTIRIGTSHAEERFLEIPFLINPPEGFDVSPGIVHLGVLTPARLTGRPLAIVTVHHPRWEAWQVTDIRVPAPFVHSRLSDAVDGVRRLELHPADSRSWPSSLDGILELTVVHQPDGHTAVIAIPVHGFWQAPDLSRRETATQPDVPNPTPNG
jgi:hypothetical protein